MLFKKVINSFYEQMFQGDYWDDRDSAEVSRRVRIQNSFDDESSSNMADTAILALIQHLKGKFHKHEGRTERDAEHNSTEATKIIDRLAYYINDVSEECLEEDDNEDEDKDEGVTWT